MREGDDSFVMSCGAWVFVKRVSQCCSCATIVVGWGCMENGSSSVDRWLTLMHGRSGLPSYTPVMSACMEDMLGTR